MNLNLENIPETIQKMQDFEKDLALFFREGKIKGASHFSRGNEEQLIKIFRGLRKGEYITHHQARDYAWDVLAEHKFIEIPEDLPENHPLFTGVKNEDYLCLSYRNHYHCLLKGVPEKWLKNQILEGWSMTPINLENKIISSGIVPGQIPIALGIAKALKLKNSLDHVWAFCGDMAAETGIFHECSKYAENYDLPITFIVEDNGTSVDTPTEKVWRGYNNFMRNNTARYRYKSGVPHQGVGREVGF